MRRSKTKFNRRHFSKLSAASLALPACGIEPSEECEGDVGKLRFRTVTETPEREKESPPRDEPKERDKSADDFWLAVYDVCEKSRKGEISHVEWQLAMEDLYRSVDLDDLKSSMGYESLISQLNEFPARGPKDVLFDLPEVLKSDGVETFHDMKGTFEAKMFAFRPGKSIPPHAHNHLQSAFLVMEGQLDFEDWERIQDVSEDGEDFIKILQTSKGVQSAGDVSSIGNHRRNVHFYRAKETLGVTLLIFRYPSGKLMDEFENRARNTLIWVDTKNAEDLGHGFLKAKKIDANQAYTLFP